VVALVLYAFSTGERSARAIETHCRQDVAFRVICGNLTPDHATIARFLRRHEQALCGLFGSVLGLCERAGLVGSGVVAMDGTKVSGNSNRDRNVDYDQIAREIIADAIKVDAAEDELYGDKRGDELPEQLRTHEGRREWLRRELGHDRETNAETGPQRQICCATASRRTGRDILAAALMLRKPGAEAVAGADGDVQTAERSREQKPGRATQSEQAFRVLRRAALSLARRCGFAEQPFDENAVLPLAVELAVAALDTDLFKAGGAVCGAAGVVVGEDAAGEFVQATAF
jgi:Transposase domain (DUF772)